MTERVSTSDFIGFRTQHAISHAIRVDHAFSVSSAPNFQQVLTSAAAADDLPDVLGGETFSSRTLELTREGDDQLAVPGDAWAQLLYYRKGLVTMVEQFSGLRSFSDRIADLDPWGLETVRRLLTSAPPPTPLATTALPTSAEF